MWADLVCSRPYKQKLRFPKEEEILPQDCSINSCLSIQLAGLPYRFQTCQSHGHVNQALEINLFIYICVCVLSVNTYVYVCLYVMCVCVCVYIYIYAHTHIHTYISHWFCFSGEP